MRRAYHFEHTFDEVYAIVRQQIPELKGNDLKVVAQTAHAYGSSHKNSSQYESFRAIVGVSLPDGVSTRALRPVFKQLFHYETNGDKKKKTKTNGHTIMPRQLLSHATLFSRLRD